MEMGVRIFLGHEVENPGRERSRSLFEPVRENNVEYREARRRKIPLIRGPSLAQIMISSAGRHRRTHGKTTTTSFDGFDFFTRRLDPTIIVGRPLDVIKSTAQLGRGEWLIAVRR